jgi:hypothetical protein
MIAGILAASARRSPRRVSLLRPTHSLDGSSSICSRLHWSRRTSLRSKDRDRSQVQISNWADVGTSSAAVAVSSTIGLFGTLCCWAKLWI